MRISNYTRQELCNAVYAAVERAEGGLSRLEICRAIGRAKSPHILGMIQELVKGGWLVQYSDTDKFGRNMFKYRVGQHIGNYCESVG